MDAIYFYIGIISLFFFTIWNLFAVIGMVLTLRFFIQKYSKKKKISKDKKPQQEKQVATEQMKQDRVTEQVKVETPESEKEIPITEGKGIKSKEKRTSSLDKSSILLYTGAFLVGFAIFIFVAFNWQSFNNSVKTAFILGIVILFYLLGYVFSLRKEFLKVSKTFIFLGSVSIALAGIGLWKFFIEENIPSLRLVDYWFIYSILLTSIYTITYLTYRSKLYFLFGLGATYSVLIFSAPTLISEPKYRISYLLIAFITLFVTTNLLFQKRSLYKKLASPIMRITVLVLNVLNIVMIADTLFRISSTEDKLLAIGSIFLSYIMILLLYKENGKVLIETFAEGFMLPFKLFIIANILLFDASSYHYLAISVLLFIVAIFLSMRKEFKNPTFKAFVIPLIISTSLFNLVLPVFKPVYIRIWDPLPMAITYMVMSVAVQIKSTPEKYSWGRLLNIPLDLIAYVLFILAIEQRLKIGLDEPHIIGLLLVIPTIIYTSEWILTRSKKKIPLLIGSIIFFTTATLPTIDDPLFFFVITAIGVFFYFVLTVYSKKAAFTVPMVLYTLLNATAAFMLFEYDEAAWMVSLFGILLFYGNLWRIEKYYKQVEQHAKTAFKTLQYSTLLFTTLISSLLVIMVFDSDNILTLLSALLLSLFALTVMGNKWVKYLSGIGLTLGFWWLIQRSDTPIYANAQIYAFPVVIYLLILSYRTYTRKRVLSIFFKTVAYMLPMTIALIQSITALEPYNLYHGLLLLTIATTLLIYGVFKKDKLLTTISIVYIVIELFILLWDVILSIPWWMYIGLLGMGLMTMSVWIIYKFSKSGSKESYSGEETPITQVKK